MKLIKRLSSVFTDDIRRFRNYSERYSIEFDKLVPQTTRANSKYGVLVDGMAMETENYGAILKPYSHIEIITYSNAIEKLDSTFSHLTITFSSLEKSKSVYGAAADLYKSHSDCHTSAIQAYSRAAHCAAIEVLEAERRAIQDEFELLLLEARAKNPDESDPATIKAKAHELKARLANNAHSNKLLKDAAECAEGKAKVLLANVESE